MQKGRSRYAGAMTTKNAWFSFLATLGIFFAVGCASNATAPQSSDTSSSKATSAPANPAIAPDFSAPSKEKTAEATKAQPAVVEPTKSAPTQTLDNDNHYTSANGDTVHSPAHTSDGDAPPGATALCNDGTYSFSENRRGTCSHHGGVAKWL
jgi:hypothetical protein